jgi:hypothetical protein
LSERRDHPLNQEQRANIVTARQTINRAVSGETDADLGAAASMLDRVLESTCPHDPDRWYQAPDATGRDLVPCYACNVSWYKG